MIPLVEINAWIMHKRLHYVRRTAYVRTHDSVQSLTNSALISPHIFTGSSGLACSWVSSFFFLFFFLAVLPKRKINIGHFPFTDLIWTRSVQRNIRWPVAGLLRYITHFARQRLFNSRIWNTIIHPGIAFTLRLSIHWSPDTHSR